MQRPKPQRSILGVLFYLLVIGCADTPSSGPSFTVRDSAGVSVVENGPASERSEAWVLDSMPAIQIGRQDGKTWEALYGVAHTRVMKDGRIAVVNKGTNQVFFFDESGGYLNALGGAGEGPGEFRSADWVGEGPADSILVLDASLRAEVSLFSPDGEFVRRMRLPGPEGGLAFLGEFSDDSWLIMGRAPAREEPFNPSTPVTGYMSLYRADATGSVRTVGEFPSQLGKLDGMYMYGPQGYAVALVDEIAFTFPVEHEVRRYSVDGRLRQVSRLDRPLKPVPQEAIDSFTLPGNPINRRRLGNLTFASHFPAYSGLLAGPDGEIWARHYHEKEHGGTEWDVFDSFGRFRGILSMPARFTPHEAGPGYVLGVWEDSLDVEYVRLYRLWETPE